MVDISSKAITHRVALAVGCITMSPSALELLARGAAKGDALAVARIAAIQAAKRTAELIPLCHPLPLTHVSVSFDMMPRGVRCTARCETAGRTGVEMEALTAVQIGLLTVYDMLKKADRDMEIGGVRLLEKRGGASDPHRAPAAAAATALAADV